MMQSELLHPLWPYLDAINSALDQPEYSDLNMDAQIGSCEFPSMFITSDEFSESSSFPFPTMFSGDFEHLADCDNLLQVTSSMEEFPMDLGGFEPNYLISEIEGMYASLGKGSEGSTLHSSQQFSVEGNDVWSPNSLMTSEASSMDVSACVQQSLTFPREEMEMDSELTIRHLLKACGEAIDMRQKELEEAILRCLGEKVSPLGQPLERLAFNLCQEVDDIDYLKQESNKNFEAAFKAFYQIFPYGRFAHYAANTAILEAVPEDAETVHVVEFDLGEGVQLSQLIEAVAQRNKSLRVTAMKWDVEESDECAPSFEETKKQLQLYARSFGLNLMVEEVAIEDLVNEIKKANKRGGRREFIAFNCMVALPHMRRSRSRGLVMEFLRLAKDLLASSTNRGMVTIADGDACDKLGSDSSFASFFEGQLGHYQALLESIESNFPSHLAEARMVMESMFVASYVSSQAWLQKWEDIKEGCHLQGQFGLEGCRLSKANLMEAKEIVGEESTYGVRIQGQNENEMALEWNGTPLVTVSTWTNQS